MASFALAALTLFSFPLLGFSSAPQLIATGSGSHDNSVECDCYLTSGPNPGYFQYYRFYDFRSIPTTSGDDFSSPPALVTNSENQGNEPITNSYFNTTVWNDNWSIQSGNVSDTANYYPQVDSPQNVFITRNDSDPNQSTYLTLRTNRNKDFQSTAEIDCMQKNLMHSSIRARLRVIPNDTPSDDPDISSTHPVSPGAVVGFFTFESNTEESDIEILTSDPVDRIRYSNQPDYNAETGNSVPGASSDYAMQEGQVWTDWLTHRLDWYPGVSQWWIDDELVLNKTINVPSKPSGMIVNLWSDGGEWSGNMSLGEEVKIGVEWIEMVFNISGGINGPSKRWTDGLWKRSENHCQVACWVDSPEAMTAGEPVVAWNNTGAAPSLRMQQGVGGMEMLYGVVTILGLYLALI